jgi:two-component system KDP operon response regulator KdpE
MGPAYTMESGYLRFHFGQLRRKLEADPGRPRHLIAEPGIGYRFQRHDAAGQDGGHR